MNLNQTNNFYCTAHNRLTNNVNIKGNKLYPQVKFENKKRFVGKEGDWACMKCTNKNFSFRIKCNRCKIPKDISEKLYRTHMSSIMKKVELNEKLQNKVNSIQSHTILCPELFSHNSFSKKVSYFFQH